MNARTLLTTSIVGLLTFAWGCSREEKRPAAEPVASAERAAEPEGYQTIAVENGGAAAGTVTFSGSWQPPTIPVTKDQEVCGARKQDPSLRLSSRGEVRDAVVTITDIRKGKPIEAAKVTLDQKNCEYRPHVLAFPAGSTVEILNPDGVLHNVHSLSKANPPFNLAQPKFKPTMEVTIEKPEIIAVKCDVHPWMSAWLYAAENPYFSVTDESGSFSLADIPPGSYTLQVWHEKLGTKEQKIEIAPGAKIEVNFQFAASGG